MPDAIHVCPDDLDLFISIYGEEAEIPRSVLEEYEATLKLTCRMGGQGPLGYQLVGVIRRGLAFVGTTVPPPAPKAKKKAPAPQVCGEVEDDTPAPQEASVFDNLAEGTELIVDDDKPAKFVRTHGADTVVVRFEGEKVNRRVPREKVEVVGAFEPEGELVGA